MRGCQARDGFALQTHSQSVLEGRIANLTFDILFTASEEGQESSFFYEGNPIGDWGLPSAGFWRPWGCCGGADCDDLLSELPCPRRSLH